MTSNNNAKKKNKLFIYPKIKARTVRIYIILIDNKMYNVQFQHDIITRQRNNQENKMQYKRYA